MVYLAAGLGCFLAALGFGILFHIRGHNLLLAGLSGAIGGLVYRFVLENGGDEMMAMFLASLLFALYSEAMARIRRSPVTTFIIPGLIPLVPGGGMYEMMAHAVEGNVDLAMETCLRTLAVAGVLVLGLLFASALTRIVFSLKRRTS